MDGEKDAAFPSDGTVLIADIFIDSDVWDFIYARGLDLSVALPAPQFRLWITREAEFEIPRIPEPKRRFVEATIQRCEIRTDGYFGFASASLR